MVDYLAPKYSSQTSQFDAYIYGRSADLYLICNIDMHKMDFSTPKQILQVQFEKFGIWKIFSILKKFIYEKRMIQENETLLNEKYNVRITH